MKIRLEHANINVRDIEGMIRFLKAAFPEFRVSSEGVTHGIRGVQVGTAATYIVLNPVKAGSRSRWIPYTGEPGVNHLAYEVDDVEALRKRLTAAGYRDSTPPNAHPYRKRVYFYDPEGNDWEFIQYFSEDPAERNNYTLPDL